MNGTQGKWFLDEKYPLVVRTERYEVARLASYGSDTNQLQVDRDDRRAANAILIAHAPEMLRALEGIYDQFAYERKPEWALNGLRNLIVRAGGVAK